MLKELADQPFGRVTVRHAAKRFENSFCMDPLIRLIGALLLTYFASRVTRRLPIRQGRLPSVLVAHIISLGVVVVVVAVIKLPMEQLTLQTLGGLMAAQMFWLVLDGVRKQLGKGDRLG